jgi:glycosyltransferase involved in cell wall biosynthesis
VSTLAVGGAERVLATLIRGLHGRGHGVTVACLHRAGPVGRKLRDEGVRVREGLAEGVGRARLLFPRFLLDPRDPDLLFTLDHKNAIVAGALLGPPGTPPVRVMASHSTGLWGKRANFGPILRRCLERYDRVVALGPTHREYLLEKEGVRPDQVTIIPNGIPLDPFRDPPAEAEVSRLRGELGIAADAPVVSMVAALRPEKAHDVFLRAAARARKSLPGAVFLVVGDGPRREALEDLARRLGLAESARFLGVREDVPRLLFLSDLLVLCSWPVVETLPLSVMEGMAAGVPIVATRVGSVGEMVEDGETGILVEPGDDEALGGALLRALRDPGWRKRAGEEARRRARGRFDGDRMVSRYEDLFASLVSASGRGGGRDPS